MSMVIEHKVPSSDDDEDSLETDDIESENRDNDDQEQVMTAKSSEALQKYQEEMEQRFTCPLTLDFMMFPIKAGDNHTYERYAILQWFFEHQTSPLTREPLDINLFRPEKELQLEIRTYLTTNNIDIPVLANTGYSLWKRLVTLRHMINYSSQSSRRSQTSLRTIRERRYPGGRASNNSDRDVDTGVNAGMGVGVNAGSGVGVDEGRGSRRDSRYRHSVYCERCRQDVLVLSFREYPFQTCRCGTLLTRIPPPNSSMGGERSSCIIS